MKKFFAVNTKWLVFAVLFILIEGLISSRFRYQQAEEVYGVTIDRLILKKQKDFEAVRLDTAIMAKVRSGTFDAKLIAKLRSMKVMALRFEDGQLKYWTSVAIDPLASNWFQSVSELVSD